IERMLALRERVVVPAGLVDEVLSITRDAMPAQAVVDALAASSVQGRVLAAGLRALATEPRIAVADLERAFEQAGREALHQLSAHLNALGSIATAAPLMGLLGTVVGMIEIFAAQSPGSGANPAQLALGMSIARSNTAFGLIVAIPALICHRHFRRVVDGFELDLENASERFYSQLTRHTHAAARALRRNSGVPSQFPPQMGDA
ncbi:MAG: MotA/TolQ/ExbB proton channel family protein, partial [Burkholderiales bacterium]